MAKLFANSGDPEQTPHSVVSDLGLHCLPITLFGGFQTKMGKTDIAPAVDAILTCFPRKLRLTLYT